MKLSIRHRTRYRYRQPVALNPHRLLTRPREGATLRVIDHAIDAGPNAQVAWTEDVFGNHVATIGFSEPVLTLTIEAACTVMLDASPWPIFPVAVEAQRYPFRYSADDRIDLGALAVADPDEAAAVRGFADAFVAPGGTDSLALIKDLTAGMLSTIAYRLREEEGTQTPAETLALGSGSCRDLATLFIACARSLGFGARAVSGYLHDPCPSGDVPGSSHAWAEVFLPGAGWIACDPSHGRVGGAFLVPVAVARDIRRILPLTGSYAGSAGSLIDMDVDVSVSDIEDESSPDRGRHHEGAKQ